MELTDLDDDVLVIVVSQLMPTDIVSLRLCGSKRIYHATLLKAVWVEWVQQNIISKRLPWPRYALDFTLVPAKLLETLAIRAYYFDKTWSQSNPRPRSVTDIQCPAGTISWLSLFRAEWILAAATDGCLRIWNIRKPSRPPIQWRSPTSWIATALVDGIPTESDTPFQLIASFNDNQTRILEISNFDNTQEVAMFNVKAEFGGFYNLVGSRGSVVAFGADVDHHKAHVVHPFGGAARLEIGRGTTRHQSTECIFFTSEHILVIRNCNVDAYPVEPLDGLASKAPGSVLTINAVQTIHFPAPIFRAVVLNDNSERGSSVTDKQGISFLVRHESTAILKYILRHSRFDDGFSFELIQEEIYFTNISMSSSWIAHFCVGTTGKRALWISGTGNLENAFLMGCPLNHRSGSNPNNSDRSILEGAQMDNRYYEDIWASHSYRVAEVAPDGRVLWQLPGDEESCWDMCRQLAFDDAMGIVVVGTAQGHIWVLDYALSLPNCVVLDDAAVVPQSYPASPSQYLDHCLILPEIQMPAPVVHPMNSLSTDILSTTRNYFRLTPPPPPPPGFDLVSSISNIDPTEEAGLTASVGFPSIANAPNEWSTDWPIYFFLGDLVPWASDQYLGRKWEINKVYKVPGGGPRPLMFSDDPSSGTLGKVVFEMNGSFHIWDSDFSYNRFEWDGPFENILESWGGNHLVRWEMRDGDTDVLHESWQYISYCKRSSFARQ